MHIDDHQNVCKIHLHRIQIVLSGQLKGNTETKQDEKRIILFNRLCLMLIRLLSEEFTIILEQFM